MEEYCTKCRNFENCQGEGAAPDCFEVEEGQDPRVICADDGSLCTDDIPNCPLKMEPGANPEDIEVTDEALNRVIMEAAATLEGGFERIPRTSGSGDVPGYPEGVIVGVAGDGRVLNPEVLMKMLSQAGTVIKIEVPDEPKGSMGQVLSFKKKEDLN